MLLANIQALLTRNLRNIDEPVAPQLSQQLVVDRVSVYRGNVMGAQLHSLQNIFPICERILGKKFFEQSLRSYVLEHPITGVQLDEAQALPNWLAGFIAQNSALTDYAYLVDLSRLELAIHHAWYADNAKPFDFSLFAEMSEQYLPNQLILAPSPSLGLIKSPWPVDKMWSTQMQNENDSIEAEGSILYLLILRENDKIIQHRLSQKAFYLLRSVQAKSTLEQLNELHDPTEIPKLIQLGAVSSFFVEN